MSELQPSFPQKTNIYLNSINADDKSTINIDIPDGVITCNDNEEFYVSIISFNTFYTFYQIIDGYNNNFNVYHNGTKHSFKIPIGNISVNDIISYFESIKNTAEIILTYDKKINKFNFAKQNSNHNIVLELINCHSILGFRKTETSITLTHPTLVQSSIPVNVMSITNLYLHLNSGYDLSLNDNNLDNFNSSNGIVKSNNIVCSVPVKECYNGIISYENYDGGNSFQFRVNRQEIIQSLSITIKDQFDKIIPNMPDFSIIIQLQKKLKSNPQYFLLRRIQESIDRIYFIISNFILMNSF